MAIALSGVTAANSGTTLQAANTPIVVALPAGAAAGHVAVFWLETAAGAATVAGPSSPSVWTEHANGDSGGGTVKVGLWSRTLDAGDITAGSVSATRTGSTSYSAILTTWSGCAGVDAVSAVQNGGTATTTPTIPAVTPVAASCLRLGVVAARISTSDLTASATPPTSWTEHAETIDARVGAQRRLTFVDSIQLSGQAGVAQATTTATTTQSATYAAYSITLAPAAAGATASLVATGTLSAAGTAIPGGGGAAGYGMGYLKPAPYGTAVAAPPPPTPVVTTEGPKPIVEIGFTTGSPVIGNVLHWDDETRGFWDTNTWAADDLWTDVTPWLQAWSFSRGANRVEGPVLRYEAGTATVTLINNDRRFDPTNLSGPYVTGGVTQVRPMVPLRIRGSYGGVADPLWSGYVDAVQLTRPAPDYSQAVFTATDAQKALSGVNRVALTAPVGGGELSGARVNRILDSVGWPALDRAVSPGKSAMQGTTMDSDAWTELLLVQDSEIGEVFVNASGKVVFRGRHNVFTRAQSITSQATFGQYQLGELPYVSVTPEYDDATVRNLIRIARVGGVQQVAQDAPSIVLTGWPRTHDRTDLLLTTDAECLDYATFILAQVKDFELRFAQIVIDPRAVPDVLFPLIFGAEFGDRITIRARPPGGGVIERDVFIRGIEMSYGGTNRWSCTWTLQSAFNWSFGTWDSSVWDGFDWAY